MKGIFTRSKKDIYYRKKRNSLTGFSLVETLVAITILSVAISATLSLARQGLSTALVSKQQIESFYLAIEGMELVRDRRATNVIGGLDWLDGFLAPTQCFNATRGCTIDAHTKLIASCPGSGCVPLQYNSTSNQYGYANGGNDTTHVRKIVLNEVVADQEVVVTISVSWRSGSLVGRDVVLEERMFNWTSGF